MLKKRVITALWGIPLLVAAVWFDQPLPWFAILVAIWGILAAFEFYTLVGIARTPLLYLGLAWTLLFILSPYFGYDISPVLTLAVVVTLVCLLFLPQKERGFNSWAWAMAGILYIGWLLSHLVALRGGYPPLSIGGTAGRNWVFFTLFTTFGSDTAAFFVGRALGRHRLAPKISPGKTWEGTVAGILGAIIVSLLFTIPSPLSLPLGYWQAIPLGLAVSIFGQLGDLVESLLKRNMGAKDSGKLLPGHGGFLDRIDSIIFAGVVVYYYVIWAI